MRKCRSGDLQIQDTVRARQAPETELGVVHHMHVRLACFFVCFLLVTEKDPVPSSTVLVGRRLKFLFLGAISSEHR